MARDWFTKASREAERASKRETVTEINIKDDRYPFLALRVGESFPVDRREISAGNLRKQAAYRTRVTGRVFSVKSSIFGLIVTRTA